MITCKFMFCSKQCTFAGKASPSKTATGVMLCLMSDRMHFSTNCILHNKNVKLHT